MLAPFFAAQKSSPWPGSPVDNSFVHLDIGRIA
jgi:hypothetical protein